jgi:hypothetical protein
MNCEAAQFMAIPGLILAISPKIRPEKNKAISANSVCSKERSDWARGKELKALSLLVLVD